MEQVDSKYLLYLIITILVVSILYIVFIISRLKKCPSDKIMVILGKVGKNSDGTPRKCVCIHGGTKYIYPFVQTHQFLDLNPITFEMNLKDILDLIDIEVKKSSTITIGISTEVVVMENAAEYLLGLDELRIKELAKDMIYERIRLLIESMKYEDIPSNIDVLLDIVHQEIESKIKKVGLTVINFSL